MTSRVSIMVPTAQATQVGRKLRDCPVAAPDLGRSLMSKIALFKRRQQKYNTSLFYNTSRVNTAFHLQLFVVFVRSTFAAVYRRISQYSNINNHAVIVSDSHYKKPFRRYEMSFRLVKYAKFNYA